ncbi:hypothetical protein DI09_18p80 [Mitosporidium daphniae]|uniref:Transmembrane 9 superfamily member n=1 Tax=Mitosporidium daphniae TaxID=1485682 RepID=A0A098VTK4_9MICR|nr:uncharacterized protein DI09_18p80 [Mitosporidium daphniae]KGG52302.1 hypothetical protein DI09_18p80 [Mitosporidium daphniae]|eukprot:XP_013238763.1 uncharacterized protein DI09_18p80 [Mitosporidium daphniae]
MTFNVQTRVDYHFTTWTVWIRRFLGTSKCTTIGPATRRSCPTWMAGNPCMEMYLGAPQTRLCSACWLAWASISSPHWPWLSVRHVTFDADIVLLFFGLASATQDHSLAYVFLIGYLFLSSVSGYVSSRFFKLLGGRSSIKLFISSVLFCPLTVCMIFTLFSLFLSSSFVSLSSAFYFVFILSLFCVPLHGIGAYFGVKAPKLDVPVPTMEIPRPIPRPSGYKVFRPLYLAIISGLFPVAALWLVVRLLNLEFWIRQAYSTLAFVSLATTVFFVTVAEVSIISTYIQLCKEDYRWWWNSFLSAGATGVYTLLLSSAKHLHFMYNHGITSTKMVYFCWCFMLSLGVSIVSGMCIWLAYFRK